MSATRLRGIEKRLEYLTHRTRSIHSEEQGFAAEPLPLILTATQRVLPISIAIWSVLELPIELILAQSSTERFASVMGRLTWVALALGAMYRKRFARAVFVFMCAVSSLVVAQALPMAYDSSTLVFAVLAVDFVLKVSVLLAALIFSLRTPRSR
jgi:hypothetical protein